ncbi:MAG TPA: DUF1707 domain-containing protein [Streptosporangiaceae bacterium]|nr:DUF1707 domain-containing protein [Streptosporangiaceae bacterium]
MTSDGGIRASDSDREHVVEILRDAYSTGRLTLDEFDERTTAAFSAKTWGALRELTEDLPQVPRLGITQPEPARTAAPEERAPVSQGPPRHRFTPMLPILVVWLGIALSAREPAAFVPVLVIMLLLLRLTVRQGRGRRPGDRDHHDQD